MAVTINNLVTLSLLAVIINPCVGFVSWSSVAPALERMASYGYEMLGYDPPGYIHHKGEVEVPIVWDPIWNGHIPIGDFVSPLLKTLATSQGGGYEKRVVKGYENRLGLRVAIPYFGDFQVTRELGPGRFMDVLGPGRFPYPGLQDREKHKHEHHGSQEHHHKQPDKTDMYQSLRNYPWNRR